MATLAELCRAIEGELQGSGDVEITGVASVESAGPHDIAPLVTKDFLKEAHASGAGALLLSREFAADFARLRIVADFALADLNRIMEILGLVTPPPPPGVHETAVVDDTAALGADVHVGPNACLGPNVRIGARTILQAGVVVQRGVTMGDDCVIEPGAVLHEGCVLGHRVLVGAHAVLSRQGFGFAPGADGPVHLHHLGQVVVEDDVHIGAGTMIDRARFDDTRIGRFSALDNLVHVGHNTRVGSTTFVAAQTGMAGNSRIGNQCEIGGQVGVANRGGCGDRCRVGAQGGLTKLHGDDLMLWGTPAVPKGEYMRQLVAMRRITRVRSHL